MNKTDIWMITVACLFCAIVGLALGYHLGEDFTLLDIKEQKQKEYYDSLEKENEALKKKLK